MFLHYLFHLRSCAANAASGGSGPSPTSNGICCDLMSSYPGFPVNIVLQLSMLSLSLAFWYMVNGYMLDIHFTWWCRPFTIVVICLTMMAMQILAARDAEHWYYSVVTAALACCLIPYYMLVFPEANTSAEDPMAEFARMNLRQCKVKAKDEGIGQEEIEAADDAQDPRDAVIQIILQHRKAMTPAKDPMAEFARMTLKECKEKAKVEGIGQEEIDAADGAQDPRDAVIRIILQHRKAIALAKDPMAEFAGMILKECKVNAKDEGVGQEVIDAADDAQDPRDAVIQIILQHRKARVHWYKVIREDGLPVTSTYSRDSDVIGALRKDEVVDVLEDQMRTVDGRIRAPIRPNGWITLRMADEAYDFAIKVDGIKAAPEDTPADVKVQWQNTADDGQWQDLSQNDSDALEAAWQQGCYGDQTINLVRNWPYLVNLGMMKMTNPNTKRVRKLQRCATQVDVQQPCPVPRQSPAVAGVRWQMYTDDVYQWQYISQNDSDALEAAWWQVCYGDQTINLVHNWPYLANLGMMEMTNPITKRVRKLRRCAPDPRWDTEGFKKFLSVHPGVQVGYFRERHRAGLPVQRHQEIEDRFFCWGAWTPGTRLYKIEYLWQTREHPGNGLNLAKLVEYLDQWPRALDTDLIIDAGGFVSLPQRPRTAKEHGRFMKGFSVCVEAYTFASLINIYLLQVPANDSIPPASRGWFRLGLCTSLFCQRTKNDHEPLVKKLLSPEMVMSFPQDLQTLRFVNGRTDVGAAERFYERLQKKLSTVADDVDGFRFFCEQTRLAWVKVGYLKEVLAKGGLCPRRQELPEGAYFIGYPAEHLNIFVASHGWETAKHPSPNGNKIKVLVDTLSSKGASDDDLCFFDFMSLPQNLPMPMLYWSLIGLPAKSDSSCRRNHHESTAFAYALHDMSRLYAFRRSRVVVIPNICKVGELPGSRADWSGHNSTPYHRRGWCVSEYSIAKYYGRIINMENPLVQEIDNMHQWPTTLREYEDLMKKEIDGELVVRFTSKGDTEAVRLIFFRFTSSLSWPA